MTAPAALLGLAVGDAYAWPALWQRSRLLPAWTRRRARELADFGDARSVTDPVVPFGLNVTADALLPAPGDATDWAADTWRSLAAGESVDRAWARRADALAAGEPVAGRISAMTALDALAAGRAPVGAHNPHGHDDGAALRAVAVACAGGDDTVVDQDARLTNHGDAATAALVVADVVRQRAAGQVPDPGGWLARFEPDGRVRAQLAEFLPLAERAPDPWSLALAVARRLDTVYAYADLAGDTVPAALALAAWAYARPGDPAADLLPVLGAAATLTRQAGSVCPLVGALLAPGQEGPGALPGAWLAVVARPSGCSLPWAASIDLVKENP